MMKNINSFIFNSSRFVAILFILITIGCTNDAWDEHYEQLDSGLENNLLSKLAEDAQFSTFLGLIKQTDYYALLSSSQSFTIWAPNNEALAQVPNDILTDPVKLTEFIGNHISRNSYNTSINYDSTIEKNVVFVRMLNNKFIEFSNDAGTVSFGGVDVAQRDILTSNGILHQVNEFLEVRPNIWTYLNDNETDFPIMMNYYNQFNETGFDEANSTRIGTNTLGEAVYDSVFKTTNSYFKIIGDLSSEENRFSFVGLTDGVYTDIYDELKDYFQHPVEDSTVVNTDRSIFENLNFPLVELEGLNTFISTTTGNEVMIDPSTVVENHELSNGNLFVVDQLNYTPESIIYKTIRYEAEDLNRIEIGNLTDFSLQKRFDLGASGFFTNVVQLLANPDGSESNNYFEIAFPNVLSADYTINVKFSNIGASQQTKLKFEFSYVDENQNTVVHEIPAMNISNEEEGVIKIGDTYSIPVYINDEINNNYFVKLKVIIDVSEPELLIYDRKVGIDYAELVPTE